MNLLSLTIVHGEAAEGTGIGRVTKMASAVVIPSKGNEKSS
jgi:hypothetical protein